MLFAITSQLERLKQSVLSIRRRIETKRDNNEDNFFSALGVDPERFLLPHGGHDAIAAIKSTATEDWADYDIEER